MKKIIEKVKSVISRLWSIVSKPEMLVLPGQLAFFFVLSVVPIVTLIAYGASFLHLSVDFIGNFINNGCWIFDSPNQLD